MMIGYHLSCEEHGPRQLVEFARRAEDAGFDYLQISDHFHPWVEQQGNSPFVWGVIGALAEATSLPVGTAVTCPTMRIHPAIIAQAAATAAVQLEGRFFLGVGTGERLNETVLGDRWPPMSVRLEMLEEAVEVIRELWTGKLVTHHGAHYTVENARIFTLPDEPPPIIVSAFGPRATEVAAEIGDGFMATTNQPEAVARYRDGGGTGPTYAQTHVVVDSDEERALQTARSWFPNSPIPGQTGQELSLPEHFEPLGEAMPDDAFRDSFVLGDDVEAHRAEVRSYLDAGYDHVAVHQAGPDQDAFFELYANQVLPALRG